jgi:hypothetical protein
VFQGRRESFISLCCVRKKLAYLFGVYLSTTFARAAESPAHIGAHCDKKKQNFALTMVQQLVLFIKL